MFRSAPTPTSLTHPFIPHHVLSVPFALFKCTNAFFLLPSFSHYSARNTNSFFVSFNRGRGIGSWNYAPIHDHVLKTFTNNDRAPTNNRSSSSACDIICPTTNRLSTITINRSRDIENWQSSLCTAPFLKQLSTTIMLRGANRSAFFVRYFYIINILCIWQYDHGDYNYVAIIN